MKFIKDAKETWAGLKEQQKAFVFQSVWYGTLMPGVPSREKLRVKNLMNEIKKRVGRFPGLMYEQAYQDIEDFKNNKLGIEELRERLFVFYPIESRIGLKVSPTDLEFNKQMRLKMYTLDMTVLNQVLEDLKTSEARDKLKVLNSI